MAKNRPGESRGAMKLRGGNGWACGNVGFERGSAGGLLVRDYPTAKLFNNTQPVVAQRTTGRLPKSTNANPERVFTTAPFVEHLRRSSIIHHQTPGALRAPGLCC